MKELLSKPTVEIINYTDFKFMDQSTHSMARPASGKAGNKEKVIGMIESQILDKLKSIWKEAEYQQQERQHRDKQDTQKDDQLATSIIVKIKEWNSQTTFKQLHTSVQNNRNIPVAQKAKYIKPLNDMHTLVTQIAGDQSRVKIKLNQHFDILQQNTTKDITNTRAALTRLEQAGCCGVGTQLRAFEAEIAKLEIDIIQWLALPKLENNNIQLQLIKMDINFEAFRDHVLKVLREYYPDGETKIVEKIVEKPVDRVVEKIVYVDKPVEKIVEKVVEKKVEVKVPEYREIVKEVVRDQPVSEKIREAHEMLYGIGRPQNITQALNDYYEEADVHSNVIAYNAIAQLFYEGKFFPKDLNKAYAYWEKSAAANNAEGLYRIGRLMLDKVIDGVALSQGRIQNRDEEILEAITYLQNAGEQGHLEALVDLGQIFEHGQRSEDSPEKWLQEQQLDQAEFYYQQGKKIRYPRAINALGLFYLGHPEYQETIVGNNARKAIKYFEMARDLGYANSLFWLAQCYERGYGVPPNLEFAKACYKEGALKGDVECKTNYMHFLMQDASHSGRQEDYMFCHIYLMQVLSSNPELTETYFYLGHLYECGFGVTKDPSNAIHFYFKGARLGNAHCMTKLGDCYHSGFGVAVNHKEALRYYTMAAEHQDSEAHINMGMIYEHGYEGVPMDYAKAFNSYETAAKLGNPKAEFHLGLMYETGKYVKKDQNYAIERYKKAARLGCQEARDMLRKKQVPILYDDGVHTDQVEIEDATGKLSTTSAFEKRNLLSTKEQLPLIQNPLIVNQGKKTNPLIMTSKQIRADNHEGKMQSILTQNLGNMQQVQSQTHFQRGGY